MFQLWHCPKPSHNTLARDVRKIVHFLNEFLLILNLSVRSRFSRAQAFVVIVCICSDQGHVFESESVSPRCLCVSVSVSMVLFMSNGKWCGRCNLRENIMDSVFLY